MINRMKKYILIIIVFMGLIFSIKAEDYNPVNPPEPNEPIKYYELKLSANPSNGGSVYGGGNVEQGKSAYIYTYSNSSMVFKYWKKGDEVVSTSTNFYYTPESDTELIAHFEFNPTSPDDPKPEDPKYMLTVGAIPSNGGYTNISSGKYKVEESVYLYAYTYSGFIFKGWSVDGKIVSESRSYYYQMAARDVKVFANYEFDPSSPGDPDSELDYSCYMMIPDFEVEAGLNVAYPIYLTNIGQQVNAISFNLNIGEDIVVDDFVPTGRMTGFDVTTDISDGVIKFNASSQTEPMAGTEGMIGYFVLNVSKSIADGEIKAINLQNIKVNNNHNLEDKSGFLRIKNNTPTFIDDYNNESLSLTYDGYNLISTKNCDFVIYSLTGKVIKEKYNIDNLLIDDLNIGVYIIKYGTTDIHKTMKIIVK